MKTSKIGVLLLTFGILVGTTVAASAKTTAHMVTAGKTRQPIGHAMFCRQFVKECSVRSTNTKPTKLTRERWDELVEVNNQINIAIQPVTDLEYYKVEEFWTYPKKYGDCEDYVLLKRYMLMQMGWPASSLLITVARLPDGGGHAVLTVRTDRADYVLDNLKMPIKSWENTEYTYLKRQSIRNTGNWVKIRDKHLRLARSR